jgi:hypothetical protein
MQTTSNILMIRPVNFGFNAETAINNAFQSAGEEEDVQEKALREFDGLVSQLRQHHIDVLVVNDTPEPHTPDAIFPNNWISTHDDGQVFLYPMFAPNRRAERKESVLNELFSKFHHENITDLSGAENENRFLEGTGSMVLDRTHRIIYACISPRTDARLLEEFAKKISYEAMAFHSYDLQGREIYHTNVMMCVARQFVVICLESITDPEERARVADKINSTGKNIVEISYDQMNQFAGNMLQVENRDGELFLVMSSRAYQSLSPIQVQELTRFNKIIHADLSTIENNGGGSARCMMAEIFLPLKRLQ